jgi:hypothetical protein
LASDSLSIVVASNGAPGSVEACVAALQPQLDGAELIVPPERPGALVPELWRDGIDAATGDIVALTISPMRPAPDWVAQVRALLAGEGVVAGAIDPGDGLRLVDWAEYFCRYARDMRPFERRENPEIPGDNCAYRRELLERTRELYRHGFWEPEVNRALRGEGVKLWHDPALVVFQGRSAGFGAFMRQRFVHGREYGRLRGKRFGAGRNAAGVALAVVVPFVLVLRTAQEVFARGRFRWRFLASLPVLLAYDGAWAVGEAFGHVDSLRGA